MIDSDDAVVDVIAPAISIDKVTNGGDGLEILAGAALAVAYRVKAGASLSQAIDGVLADIKHLGGDGGIIAVDATGRIEMIYNSEGMKRAAVHSNDSVFVATFD